MNNECPNCGATINDSQKCCKYCGTENANFKALKDFQPVKSDLENVVKKSANQVKKANINIFVFILLLIFCWPIALVYLFVKLAKTAN